MSGQPLRDDRLILGFHKSDLTHVRQVAEQLSGLADALEIEEDEKFVIHAGESHYSLHLTRYVGKESISLVQYTIPFGRQSLADAITNIAHNGSTLRDIITARKMAGQTVQNPGDFLTHPMLLKLLEISNITPQTFIDEMKGHIGGFRTHVSNGFNDGSRRSRAKVIFPLCFAAKGSTIIPESITLGKVEFNPPCQISLRMEKGECQAILTIPEILPDIIAGQILDNGECTMFDDDNANALFAGESIESTIQQQSGTRIAFKPRPLVPMGQSDNVVEQNLDRMLDQVSQWAAA